METNAAAPAFLVLADTFYPGWRADVDGARTPIHLTDFALRGVAVPAGRHTVTFAFASAARRVGFLQSLVSLVIAAGLLAIGGARPVRS